MLVEVPFVPGSALAAAGALEATITPPPPPPPGPCRLPGYGEPGALGSQVCPPSRPSALRVAPASPPERTSSCMEPPAPPPPPPSCNTSKADCPFAVKVPVPTTAPAWIIIIPPPAAPLLLMPLALALAGSAVPLFVVLAPPPRPIMSPPTKPIPKRCSVPGVAAVAAATPVATTAAAGVLRVSCRISVGAATTCITCGAASVTPVRQTFDGGGNKGCYRGVREIVRSPGNALSLGTVSCQRRERDVIVLRAACTTR